MLREPVGILIEGEDFYEVARKVSSIIREGRSWCVGDLVVKTLIDIGFVPDVAIIDGKTLREKEIDIKPIEHIYRSYGDIFKIKNPSGHINLEIIDLIKKIVEIKRKTLILVDGEEDLLSLPVIAYAPDNEYVVYGLPGRGVIVIKIDSFIREKVFKILEQMIPIAYDS
jgi:hypothetical protein